MNTKSSQVIDDVKESYKIIHDYISHDIEALQFVDLYAKYIHAIDDIVDESFNPELIVSTFNLAANIYSLPFWIKHHNELLVVVNLMSNQYSDVVGWEKSNDKWKRREAQALSHVGYNMLFAVVLLVAGYGALRECSSKFRAWSHFTHLEHSPEFKNELD